MTLFVGYAASKCEESLMMDNMFGIFGQYNWYHTFLFTLKYTYGTMSALVFYFLIFHKYKK